MIRIFTKKLLLLICFLGLLILSSTAQNVGDFQSNTATGNWNATTSWQQCFSVGVWSAATSTPTFANGVITIRTGHTITVNAATTVDQVIVNNGGIISIATTQVLTVNNGTLTDLQIDAGGIVRCLAATSTLTINASADVLNNGSLIQTIGTAIINNNGIITNSGTFTSTNATNVRFLAGSFYKHSFLSSVAVPGVIPASTWNATSTCEILACGNTGAGPTGISQGFGHFIWNNTTQPVDISLDGLMTTAIAGNFTLNSTSTFSLILSKTIAGVGVGTTTVNGNFVLNAGKLVILQAVSISHGYTLRVNGTYTQNGGTMTIANCSGTFGANVTNGTLDVQGAGGSSIVGGIMNVNTGTWTGVNGNGTFSSVGPIALNTAGVINGCSSTAVGGTGAGGTITGSSTITIGVGGTLNLNTSTTTGGGGSTTMSASGLLTISGGTVNGSSAAIASTGCTTLINAFLGATISSGTFNLTPGGITTGGGSGTMNVSGAALAISGGTVNINSSTGTIATGLIAVTGFPINISGAAIVNVASGSAIAAGGNGSLTTTGAFNMTGGTLNLCSTTGACTGDGLLDIDGVATFSSGTFNITSSTTSSVTAGKGVVNIGGNFVHTTAAANFLRTSAVATATGTVNINGTSGTQTLQSTNGFTGTITFNISNAGLSSARCTIPAAITFTVNSGTTFNVNDNSANVTGDELQVFNTALLKVSGIMNVQSDATLNIIGTTTIIGDATTGGGTFNLNAGGVLMTQHSGGIRTLASGAFGSIQVTGARNYSSDADYTYYGTVSQITGNGLPTTLTGILKINNTAAIATNGVTLSQSTVVNGVLTLTAGRLISTSTNLIAVGNGGSVSPIGGSAASYVEGPIKKIGNSSFIYPTGHVLLVNPGLVATSKWARIEISAPTNATDEFTAQYYRLDDPGPFNLQVLSQTNAAPILRVSCREYWELARSGGATINPTVKLYWESGAVTALGSGIQSTASANLRVVELVSPTTWTDRGVTGLTGTAAGPGTITSNIATSFSGSTPMPFTFGGQTLVNPLPIELLTFNGHNTMDGNQLLWATATELNNDYFELQRSQNEDFSNIATIDGHGNSSMLNNYSYLDKNPLNGINYYRLKQVDFNGDYTYSSIIAIDKSNENTLLEVYPNPSTDFVNIITSANIASVCIYNMLGDIVYTQNESITGAFTFKPLASGVYIVKATTSNGEVKTNRFIIK